MLRTLWLYRGLVIGSVAREFQAKYRNSLLGIGWTIINPLAMILVYTVIFSQVMRAKLPGVDDGLAYSIYLCAGILTWSLFAEVVTRCQNIFIDNANLLKKINFPRTSLPAIALLSSLLSFAIIFGIFLGFLFVSGRWPGWAALATLPVLLVEVCFAIGLGMILGVLNVFFRDVGQFFGIFLQFWFWCTPIVYPVSVLPESVRAIMPVNPMLSIIQAYQEIFIAGAFPNWLSLVYPSTLALLLCALALHLFRRHAGEMVDEL